MNPELRALIIEDDPDVRLGCEQAMMLADIPVEGVGSAEEGFQRLKPGFPGVVVTDMRLPKADGMEVLRRCQAMDADLPVIIITGHGDVTLAVEAMRAGAYDFIQKPFSPELLVDVVRRALEKRALTLEVLDLRRRLEQREGAEAKLIGRSPQMARVRQLVTDVASTRVDVLVRGETGTGKELIAQCLHELSTRKDGPFVALNCGGLPDNLLDSELFGHEAGAFTGAQKRRIGKIEYANKGTLFLDELESMPMGVQIKLLRVLQERCFSRLGGSRLIPFDARIVAATHRRLDTLVAEGRFREDLYYRIKGVGVCLPALRERGDRAALIEALLTRERRGQLEPVLSPEAQRVLMAYPWPGNIRQLDHVLRLALTLAEGEAVIGLQHLPEELLMETAGPGRRSATVAGDACLREIELEAVRAAMARNGGNVSATARSLGVARATLYRKLRLLGLA